MVRSCQRSIGSVSTASATVSAATDVTWPAVACVCKSMKLACTGFEHVETKTEELVFFREEVDFLSSLAFVVNN